MIQQTTFSLAELGNDPCIACEVGWCTASENSSEFCQDSCERYKVYRDRLPDEPLFGEHLKEAKEVLCPLLKEFLIRFRNAWKALGGHH